MNTDKHGLDTGKPQHGLHTQPLTSWARGNLYGLTAVRPQAAFSRPASIMQSTPCMRPAPTPAAAPHIRVHPCSSVVNSNNCVAVLWLCYTGQMLTHMRMATITRPVLCGRPAGFSANPAAMPTTDCRKPPASVMQSAPCRGCNIESTMADIDVNPDSSGVH